MPKTHNTCTPCKHPAKHPARPPVKFLPHQSPDSLLALVQSWWEFPREAYGILHTLIMVLETSDKHTQEFIEDLQFLRELLLFRNLMVHMPD